jgi:DNA-binding NarL/FixJ family response regulator
MRVLIIDDHLSFCEGLKSALEAAGDSIQVDFEADAQWIPFSVLKKTEYDLLMIDIMMPGIGGLELLRYLNANHHPTPVVVLSSVEDPDIVRRALDLGAVGYLPKSYSVYQILDAIDDCRQGHIHVPNILPASQGAVPEKFTAPGLLDRFSRRQLEIISLMGQGLSNQEIANQLFISKATVKTHVNHLFKALNVNNRISCLRAIEKLQTN